MWNNTWYIIFPHNIYLVVGWVLVLLCGFLLFSYRPSILTFSHSFFSSLYMFLACFQSDTMFLLGGFFQFWIISLRVFLNSHFSFVLFLVYAILAAHIVVYMLFIVVSCTVIEFESIEIVLCFLCCMFALVCSFKSALLINSRWQDE